MNLRASWPACITLALTAGCSGPRPGPAAPQPAPVPRDAPTVEVVATADDTPPGGDGAPRLTLAFRYADGRSVPLAEQATAWAPFRDGVALVALDRRLLLVTPDGAERVLALQSGAPPVQAPGGELVYVAQHAPMAEVHVLDPAGRDVIVATDLASAGVLAPQPDGRLVFVAAENGGVAGLWLAKPGTPARCLTNCDLRTGTDWGGRQLPLPTGPEAIAVRGGRVEWDASDGTRRVLSLAPADAVLPTLGADVDEGAVAPTPEGAP